MSHVVRESAFVAMTSAAADAVARAARASATAAIARPVRAAHVGILTASAYATHVLLLQMMPARIAPVRPLAYFVALAFVAFAVIAGRITTRSNATATAESSAGTANTRKS